MILKHSVMRNDAFYKKTEEIFVNLIKDIDSIKHGEIKNAGIFLDFQPTLADALYELMQRYHECNEIERKLVDEKETNPDFLQLIRENGKQKQRLKQLIRIGKSIGDGFAYFFYRNSLSAFRKHYSHQETGLFPSGIGGRGEIEFIKNNQNIDGLFTVYHSITNVLRNGDFSLCTVDGHVIAIGELKSIESENKLTITAYITSKAEIKGNDSLKLKTENGVGDGNVKKQIDQHELVLHTKKAIRKDNKYQTKYNYELLDHIDINGAEVLVSDDKSIVVLVVDRSDRDDGNDAIDATALEKLKNAIEQYLAMDSDYDAIIINQVKTDLKGFRKPIVWWDLDVQVIKEILFGERIVCVCTNLAFLTKEFECMGYTISDFSITDEEKRIEVSCGMGDLQARCIINDTFIDLITNDFMRIGGVVKSVDDIFKMKVPDDAINSRIDIEINQGIF